MSMAGRCIAASTASGMFVGPGMLRISRPPLTVMVVDFNLYHAGRLSNTLSDRSTVELGHRLDLDQRVRDRQVRDLHQCAHGWVRPEELRAHFAVGLAIAHVGDEHGDLDDIVRSEEHTSEL